MQAADENGSDGLDIDEFRAAFGQILGKGKKDQQVWVSISLCMVWVLLKSCSLHCFPAHSIINISVCVVCVCVDGSHVHEDRHQL